MAHLNEGQCGLCSHFDEHVKTKTPLVKIRQSHEAPVDLLGQCGHPKHEPLHLKVSPLSGCDGFELAEAQKKMQ